MVMVVMVMVMVRAAGREKGIKKLNTFTQGSV
jgi:hypothetical protein